MANLSKVYLLNVPLENDYKNTLYFASKEAQYNYFYSKRVKSYDDLSYQRKDHLIRIPAMYDDIQICNYVMYQNTAYSNKWYYAFITKMEYKDDGRTDIIIETDCIQTWFFDYTVKHSFIEREHVTNDTIGLHTVPEGLETGEYVSNTHNIDTKLQKLHIVWGTTVDSTGANVKGANYQGIYSGLKYYSVSDERPTQVSDVLQLYANMGKTDAITCLFLAPEFLTEDSDETLGIENSNDTKAYVYTHSKTFLMNGYTPRNNKLFTFPYNYLLVSNNAGGSAIYQFEHFEGESTIEFKIEGALCPGCSIRLVPYNYKGSLVNDEEGLNLGKFPICNWNSDVYTNWLTQNSVNIGISLASNVGSIVGGAVMMVGSAGAGAVVGGATILSGVKGIADTLGQVHQQSFTPPQSSGNVNCGDVITASAKNTFHFYNMSIKKEYSQIIDNFFDMFGYKVNVVKVPNKNHRKHYWFTKTIDVNIDGPVPNADMQIIKNCYNNGITFWRNASEMNNYSLDNTITV